MTLFVPSRVLQPGTLPKTTRDHSFNSVWSTLMGVRNADVLDLDIRILYGCCATPVRRPSSMDHFRGVPKPLTQCLIVMVRDPGVDLYVPAMYVLMYSKHQEVYGVP